MAEQKTTTNHEEIKKWAENHNGVPAVIKETENGSGAGLLRIHFEDSSDDEFEQVSWNDFFGTFEKKDLAFLYQDKQESTFHKFVDRNNS